MADLADVSTSLVNLIAAALYPSGTGSASAIGADCYIFPGWPNSTELDKHLRAGAVEITVYPQPNMERVTTRYPREWRELSRVTPTVTAAVSGATVTIGGAVTTGHYVTLLVAGQPYSYAAQAGDTLTSIAAALAALINVNVAATAAGAVITMPALMSGRIVARTGAPATLIRELRRQQRGYQVIIWAPSPALRSAAAKVIDGALTGTDFVPLADGTTGWLVYRSSDESDKGVKALEYRRDIFWWVEYPTTETMTSNPVTAFVPALDVTTSPAP